MSIHLSGGACALLVLAFAIVCAVAGFMANIAIESDQRWRRERDRQNAFAKPSPPAPVVHETHIHHYAARPNPPPERKSRTINFNFRFPPPLESDRQPGRKPRPKPPTPAAIEPSRIVDFQDLGFTPNPRTDIPELAADDRRLPWTR
jgi:hypothetical protein